MFNFSSGVILKSTEMSYQSSGFFRLELSDCDTAHDNVFDDSAKFYRHRDTGVCVTSICMELLAIFQFDLEIRRTGMFGL